MSGSAESKKQYYLVLYEYPSDILEKRKPFREQHLKLSDSYKSQGHIILSGPFDPISGAALIFHVESRETVEKFLSEDPYVLNKVTTRCIVHKMEVRPFPTNAVTAPSTTTTSNAISVGAASSADSGLMVHDLESYALAINQRNEARSELARARDEIATLKNRAELAEKSLSQMRKERDGLQDQIDANTPVDVNELVSSLSVDDLKKDGTDTLSVVKELKKQLPRAHNPLQQLVASTDISKFTLADATAFLIQLKQLQSSKPKSLMN